VALPLLLAGPILRRVESNLVSVWLALRDEADVSVSVFEGVAAAGAGNPFLSSTAERTWRLGDKLHLALATVRIPENAGKSFQPDVLYSYDITIKVGSTTHTLQSLNMLRDVAAEDSPDGITHVALGYQTDVLPSFAPCPSQLTDVRILYGSCRRPGHRDPDAMVWMDDDIHEHLADPRARPHQLFLGGDQIYADDVDSLLMFGLMDLGIELIGTNDGGPVEQVLVDKIMRRTNASPDPAKPHLSYVEESPTRPAPDRLLPIDKETFPAGQRLALTRRAAQFTSSDGSSHLISFGEFAAMYLLVWSNACWTDEIPGVSFIPDWEKPIASQTRTPLLWSSKLTKQNGIVLPPRTFPLLVSQHFFPEPDPEAEAPSPQSPEEKATEEKEKERKHQRGLRRSHRYHASFLEGLAHVRRVLANVPTYMIFDDHDVTDDFFLNPMWRDRVLGTALGQTIFHNGMLSYALFQDWGNDPRRYDEGLRAELITRAMDLFPVGASTGPARSPFERLAVLFGHDLRHQPDGVGGFASVNPPISWHYTVDAPTHRTLALDNRTRRSYPSRLGPPGNISVASMIDQIPPPPLLAGQQMLIVIAPLQVIGPPVIDDVVAPLTYRIFDLTLSIKDDFDLSARSTSGLRGMLGTNPDAIEAWAFDAPTFEHLLQRLEPYRRVVLLSGDVHNSTGTMMSYWRGAATQPAHFAQFVSSGLKNVMPTMITAVDRSAAFAQQLVRANLGTERIGWERPHPDLVLLPEGKTPGDLTPNMRSRLVSTPVMIPTWGWPDHPDPSIEANTSRLNPTVPPDWRWRVKPLLDERTDAERPAPIRQLEIDLDKVDRDLGDKATLVNAYQAVAARHQHALGHMRNARQILFRSNYGVCRFQTNAENGHLEAVHEVYTAFADPDQPAAEDPSPEPYLVQVADLDRDDEVPPARLRRFVIEPTVPDV
jgi:hypothetical protein